MTTATETAMTALAAVLTGAAGLPNVRRDVILDTLMEDFASEGKALSRALVLRIGDPVETERYIGVGDARFELVRNADAELFVSGPEGTTLITAFDTALEALFVALETNPTLSGAVTRAEITAPPEIDMEEAGARVVLQAIVKIELTFLSPRAY